MKCYLIATLTAILSSSVLADSSNSKFLEHLGFGSGAAVGTAVAGPVGFLIGGTLGLLMGQDAIQEQLLARQTEEIAELDRDLYESRVNLKQLKASRIETEAEIIALEELLSDLSIAIHFAIGSSVTEDLYQESLLAIAEASNKIDGMQINLVGHTDAIGSDIHNQNLSEMRAKSVGLILNKAGISERNIMKQGMGKSEAVADGKSGYDALDRRVDLRISFDRNGTRQGLYSIR